MYLSSPRDSLIGLELAGDICPTGRKHYFLRLPFSVNQDICLANLESPITNHPVSRAKAGPSLRASRGHFGLGDARGQLVFSLANNHMMDYGEQGLIDTVDTCQELGIQVVGAGKRLSEAKKPVLLKFGNLSVGIIACCETQFGVASSGRMGFSPISPVVYRLIRELRQEVDVVVVSVHGGAEMCPWPAPRWQDFLRSLIDEGATVVHGHHSHVPQGYEEYSEGLILYGLGNLLVDPARWTQKPNTLWSILCNVSLSSEGIERYVIRTVSVSGDDYVRVRESSEPEASKHQRYLSRVNNVLANRELLTGVWQESAIRMYYLWNAKWVSSQYSGATLILTGF